MHNSFMSEEDFKALKSGDVIIVRQLSDLRHDFGYDISVPHGWNSDMNELCGTVLTVRKIQEPYSGTGNYEASVFENAWSFSRQMLEPYTSTISNEEISKSWEEMIFGGGGQL